jgi:glycosyltransferase involved in cell wall biosynthesis
MNWITSQIGAREHYAIPRVLQRDGRLQRLYTDFWASAPWRVFGKLTGKSSLAARFHPELATAPVTGFNLEALKFSRRRYANPYEGFLQVGRQFGEHVVGDLEKSGKSVLGPSIVCRSSPTRHPSETRTTSGMTKLRSDAPFLDSGLIFFSYDTGFLEPARWVKARGGKAIVCQMDPARYEVDLVREEEARWPGWSRRSVEVPEAYFRRREEEWAVADLVMVNSEWTKAALIRQGVTADKIVIVPLAYEAPPVEGRASRVESNADRVEGREPNHLEVMRQTAEGSPRGAAQPTGSGCRQSKDEGYAGRVEGYKDAEKDPRPSTLVSHRTLRVLFLGQVILRKGIQYLIEAAKLLKDESIHFDVVGPIGISEEALKSAPPNMTFHGSVTRDRTREFYESADLFVLPTLSDGFALTQLEAMAHGLPVIATPNCGEVVTDGVDGLIVPAGDPMALAEAFQLLIQDPEKMKAMSAATKAKVEQFSLSRLSDHCVALENRLFGAGL